MHARLPGVAFALTVLVGPVACLRASPSDPPGPQSNGLQPPSAWPPPAACQAPEATSPAGFTTRDEAIRRLQGAWRNCQTGALPAATLGGAAGFEVRSDGRYYPLGFDASGSPTRLTGFFHEGTLVVYDGCPTPCTAVEFGSNSLYPLFVTLSADGTTMRNDSIGNESGPFVRTFEAVTTPPPQPAGAHEGAAGCKTMETEVYGAPASIDEGNARILGSWTLCPDADLQASGSSVTTPPGTQGIEFSPDATWAFLMAASGAPPAPSTDPTTHGTFAWKQSTSALGGPAFQLNMTTVAGGMYFCIVTTSNQPVKLQLDNVGFLMTFSAN